MRLTPNDQARTNQLWRIYRGIDCDIDRLMESAAVEESLDAERLNQLARRKSRLEDRITEIWMRSVLDADLAAVGPAAATIQQG